MTSTMKVMHPTAWSACIRGWCLAATGALVALLGACAPGIAAQDPREAADVEAALPRHGVGPGVVDPGVIVAWNELARDIAFAEDQFLTFKGQRALAMMHLAMHDALNSIVPVYHRHTYAGRPRPAHPVAAAAQAARDVLVSQYPDQHTRLGAELDVWLGQTPSGPLRARGIALGRAAAAAILASRARDGWNTPHPYAFRGGPGQYQTTPPWNGFVAHPGFRFARPFVLATQSQFRPPPPPSLKSGTYARAFQEVAEFGAIDSVRRTEDQTAYALWWMEFAESSVNRLARQLVTNRRVHLWTAARLFAQIGMALFDGYVAIWDSKYEYNHWRPVTAVRGAETDDNPGTTSRPGWEPLRPTPPFPEYASAHAAACAASFGVLEGAFGTEVSFTMMTESAPPGMATRTFRSFDAAALECADSRVRLGWHFRYATDAGLALGRRIARHIVGHALQKPTSHAAPPSRGTASVDGVELEYEVRGQGEPVVLIHGCCFADWFTPMVHDTRIADHYRVVTYHRVGYAGSSHVAGEVSLVQQATHLRMLMRHLGISRAHLVGHSSGGNIALQLALDAPDMVGTLVLLEPALPLTAAVSPGTPPTRSFVATALDRFRVGDKPGAVDTFLRGACGAAYREALDRVLPGAFDQGVADADTFFGQELPAVQKWSFAREQARRITQPVLAVIGEKSPAVSPIWSERQKLLLAWLPRAEAFTLPGATHLLHVQNPHGMAERLLTFWPHHALPR